MLTDSMMGMFVGSTALNMRHMNITVRQQFIQLLVRAPVHLMVSHYLEVVVLKQRFLKQYRGNKVQYPANLVQSKIDLKIMEIMETMETITHRGIDQLFK